MTLLFIDAFDKWHSFSRYLAYELGELASEGTEDADTDDARWRRMLNVGRLPIRHRTEDKVTVPPAEKVLVYLQAQASSCMSVSVSRSPKGITPRNEGSRHLGQRKRIFVSYYSYC